MSSKPPLAKRVGKPHPWKPVTPDQIKEFADLWHSPDVTITKIAAKYRASERTIQKWRTEYGFRKKDLATKLGAEALAVADGAQAIVEDMSDTAKIGQACLGAQAREIAARAQAIEDGKMPVVNGVILDPRTFKNWNPLTDEEVSKLLAEIGEEARAVTGHSDLSGLQRKLSRLSVIVATKMPVQTWETLQSMLEALSRNILWARKVEADMPPSPHDPILLRQEAGRQMMKELKSVLSAEDQAALAIIMKRGADKLLKAKAANGHGTDIVTRGNA